MKDRYKATDQEIRELAQKYHIVDISSGNIKGKGSLKLRTIENRSRALSYLAGYGGYDKESIKKAYNIYDKRSNSNYWKLLIKNKNRALSKKLIDETKDTLTHYLKNYISPPNPTETTNSQYEPEKPEEPKQTEEKIGELEKVASTAQGKGGLLSRIRGSINTKVIGCMVAAGIFAVSLGFGYGLGSRRAEKAHEERLAKMERLYDTKIAEFDKAYSIKAAKLEERVEQLKTGATKPENTKNTYAGAIGEREQEKIEEQEVKPKLIAKRNKKTKTEDKEIWGNGGNFVNGYCYKNDVPEFSEEELKEREEFQKRWGNLGQKMERDQDKFESGVYDLFTLRHPIKGFFNMVSGAAGQLNAGLRGIVRPIAYFFTKNDRIDKGVDDFGDASPFGDSYNTLHSSKFFEQFQEHPVKSTISLGWDGYILYSIVKGEKGGDNIIETIVEEQIPPGREGGGPGRPPGRR